jgi:hypothetical protein
VCVSHAEKFYTGQGVSELLHFLSLKFRVMTAARLTAPVLASPCPGLFKARECFSTQRRGENTDWQTKSSTRNAPGASKIIQRIDRPMLPFPLPLPLTLSLLSAPQLRPQRLHLIFQFFTLLPLILSIGLFRRNVSMRSLLQQFAETAATTTISWAPAAPSL